jgi:hypothetical protein
MEGILVDNLVNAEIIKKPYKHTLFQLFSKELCDQLIKNYYEINQYLSSKKGLSQSRFMLDVEGDTINGINYRNIEFLKNIEPLNTVLQMYSDKLIKEQYQKYYEPKEHLRFTLQLVYDKKNYSIGPHTDSFKRAATQITYIVCDEDINKKLGVCMYKDLIDRHKETWEKIHYSFDNFEKVKQVEYYPGSSINFKVKPTSFHGVEKIDVECNRMSIQTIIWKDGY